jgi:CelD/BcsL family acetyltransferase involved in cellulose biosynthesis
VQISVAQPHELGAAEIAAWHSMQRATPSLAGPFLCPEFAIAVGRCRSRARVAVLSDGPQPAGFFAFERRRFGIGVPIGAGLTDFHGLVHAPGAEWDPRELLRACRIQAWEFDHLVPGQLPFRRYQAATVPSPYIDLGEGFDVYYAQLRQRSKSFCRNLAYKARKLTRDVGEVRFVLDSADTGGLRRLLSWKSQQYRRTGRIDRFSEPGIAEVVEALLDVRGDGFAGLLSLLYAGSELVSAHFGLRFDGILGGWFPAYDREFHSYSPGLVGHLRLAEASALAGITRIDLGKGAKDYKESLKSADGFVSEGIVTGRSPVAAVHWARCTQAHWTARQVKQHPGLFRAADQVLQRYGRVRSVLRSPPRLGQPADSPQGQPGEPRPGQRADAEPRPPQWAEH